MTDEVDRISEQHGVTDMQARVIDVLADNPKLANSEVAEQADVHPSYPSRVRSEHAGVIRDVAKERGVDVCDAVFFDD